MCREICNDNRFELIEKYKQKLIKSTNIETDKQEMEVIDNILFRFWQMGWLDKLEKYNQLEKALDKACYELCTYCDGCERPLKYADEQLKQFVKEEKERLLKESEKQ